MINALVSIIFNKKIQQLKYLLFIRITYNRIKTLEGVKTIT